MRWSRRHVGSCVPRLIADVSPPGRIAKSVYTVVYFMSALQLECSQEHSESPRVTAVSEKRSRKRPARSRHALRGRADLARLRRVSEREIQATSPPELAGLPNDFWDDAVVVPPTKQPISLRVDADVLQWFKTQGPRYQSRINAVLRSYMTQRRSSRRRAG